jgi:hypothetical protein
VAYTLGMSAELPSFLQAVEVWVPDGQLLHRASGAYGQNEAFAEASAELTLEKGRGLPGAAFQSRKPEVWHELGPSFVRAESARLSGLDAAVALPFFRGNELTAIVVFFCGSRAQTGGCIEVWAPGERGRLEHVDGYYGKLAAFEAVSQEHTFALGEGLPGQVWQRGLPQIVADLAHSSAFVRAEAARENGIKAGLGLPIYMNGAIVDIALLLSTTDTPLARAFEVYGVDDSGELVLDQSYYAEGHEGLRDASEEVRGSASTLPRRVLDSGVPRAIANLKVGAPFALALAVPIHDGSLTRAVVLILS